MITQTLFLIGISVLGGVMGMWLRRFDLQGLEIWLPMGLIVTYAMGPTTGFIVAVSILLISFFMFPYGLQFVVVMLACLAGTLYATAFLPVTASTFFMNSMILVVAYNVVSSILFLFVGYDLFRSFKFSLVSVFFSWFLFSKLGWDMVVWLSM